MPKIRVRVTTLDKRRAADLCAPKLVKLDVEGAEVEALAAMLETLQRHKPLIVCEIQGSLDDARFLKPRITR
jgi:FkbM family methyltransferase